MKHSMSLVFILFLAPLYAAAAGLDKCAIDGAAPAWAALRTPGFMAAPTAIAENSPFPGSKIFNAAVLGYDRLMLQELKKHPQPSAEANALYAAASMGRLTTTAALIGAGVSPNAEIENRLTPLYGAAMYGCSEEVEYLVSLGADLNFHADMPRSILMVTIGAKQYDTAKLLIRLGYHADKREKEIIKKMLARLNNTNFYQELFAIDDEK